MDEYARQPGRYTRTSGTAEAGRLADPASWEIGVHVGADGGVMPLSFLARADDSSPWAQVVVRMRWSPADEP